MQSLMPVGGTAGPARDIVKVVNTFDLKRHVPISFNESQITSVILYFWQFDNSAILK